MNQAFGRGAAAGLLAAGAIAVGWHLRTRPHRYLATSCLHGEHGYCQDKDGRAGQKIPASCKFCGAPCLCPCHWRSRWTWSA